MKTIEILPGTTIEKACEDAAADARLDEEEIKFEFNGVALVARPTRSADEQEAHAKELVAKWHADMNLEVEKHRASPEFKRQEELRAAEVASIRNEHEVLMKRLPYLGGDKAWMTWIKEFVRVVDDVGVKDVRQFKVVEKAMKKAGYMRNDECMPDGLDRAARSAWSAALKADSGRYARWIAGQVLDGLNPPAPCPHPMLAGEAAEWLKKHGRSPR
jgi:hypothetical protein